MLVATHGLEGNIKTCLRDKCESSDYEAMTHDLLLLPSQLKLRDIDGCIVIIEGQSSKLKIFVFKTPCILQPLSFHICTHHFCCLLRFLNTPSWILSPPSLYSHRPTSPFALFLADQAPLWEEKKEKGYQFFICGVGSKNGLFLGPMPQMPLSFLFGIEIAEALLSERVELEAIPFVRIFVC